MLDLFQFVHHSLFTLFSLLACGLLSTLCFLSGPILGMFLLCLCQMFCNMCTLRTCSVTSPVVVTCLPPLALLYVACVPSCGLTYALYPVHPFGLFFVALIYDHCSVVPFYGWNLGLLAPRDCVCGLQSMLRCSLCSNRSLHALTAHTLELDCIWYLPSLIQPGYLCLWCRVFVVLVLSVPYLCLHCACSVPNQVSSKILQSLQNFNIFLLNNFDIFLVF